jgi:hypothetical protein
MPSNNHISIICQGSILIFLGKIKVMIQKLSENHFKKDTKIPKWSIKLLKWIKIGEKVFFSIFNKSSAIRLGYIKKIMELNTKLD